MHRLPPELVFEILEHCVTNHYSDKNSLLALRSVCKMFDEGLRSFVLRTLQLEYTRLSKVTRHERPPDEDALLRIGNYCRALYLDMMVIRDDEEVDYMKYLFGKVPSMEPFVTTLTDRYCLNEKSFTEIDYRKSLGRMLECTPNVSAVRLNLPFPLVTRQVHAATMILGNSFEALAQRTEESHSLETLVLENVTDSTIIKLWNNPRDVKNIVCSFAELKKLLLSLRRHEEGQNGTIQFRRLLWEMIGKAPKLEALALVGFSDANSGAFKKIRRSTQRDCTLDEWQFKMALPTIRKPPKVVLSYLTHLELRCVEATGCALLSIFSCFGGSLKELYLAQVYLKTIYTTLAPEDDLATLWIGLPNVRPQENHRWIATCLRQMSHQLRVCRVTRLGYDQYLIGEEPREFPTYDLNDPCGLGRSLEQRFVEVVTGIKQPNAPHGSPIAYWPQDDEQNWAYADRDRPERIQPADWDAAHYLTAPETSSKLMWKKAIDCKFPNHNQFTQDQLHHFADVACKGMYELNHGVSSQVLEGELGSPIE